jgi:triacylglycerol lipase
MPATGDSVTCRSMRFPERLQFACMIFFASSLPALSKESAPPKSTEPSAQTLILDGIWGSHSRWERLRSRIATEVGPCRIWRYDNSGRVSIESLGKALAAGLKPLNTPVNLVGYSMGGLVVREALRQAPGLKVRRVALLNSPHYGSVVACLLPLSACREMRPGSAFLKQLDAAPWTHATLATWCPYDLMVFPGSSGRWKKASIVLRLDVPMHVWPVLSVEIHRSVTAFLASDNKPPFLTRK